MTTSAGTCSITGQDVACNLATLAPGQPMTVTITAATAPGAATGTRDNTATVTSGTNDSVPGNNSSTASVDIVARADLQVTKTAEPATVVPGTVWCELAHDRSALRLHVFDMADEAIFIRHFKTRYELPLKEIFG